ncbi:MAG: nucleotide exchange factor GrpE [Coriobacteriia bacterium]|nr:nucleotide exchange factor GrpE [Coriobacteriia bacterium]
MADKKPDDTNLEPGQKTAEEASHEVEVTIEEDSNESSSDDELETTKAALAASQDRYMRLQAEWDNYRKRTASEYESTITRANERLIESLLPVIDDLERAVDAAENSKPTGEFLAFVEGVEAVHDKFVSTLVNKAKLVVIDPKDEPFDMNRHQAVGTVENPEVYEETVVNVLQKGYELGGYIMRPAMVQVSTGGEKRPADDDSEKE